MRTPHSKSALDKDEEDEEDEASFRARRHHRLWELVGAGM
jgi:hypothetical protein